MLEMPIRDPRRCSWLEGETHQHLAGDFLHVTHADVLPKSLLMGSVVLTSLS